MPKLIGLVGYAGSGKGTIASVLVKGFGFKELSFAEALKKAAAFIYDLPFELLSDPEFKETPHPNLGGETPRKALQYLGTEGVRSVYENAWVDKIKRQIEADPEGKFVISDCRFPNEAEAIFDLGGKIWGVRRKDIENQASEGKYLHASEQHVTMLLGIADIVFNNNSSIEALKEEVAVYYLKEQISSRDKKYA